MNKGSERFHQLLKEAGDMHDRKQADYGTDNDPFANIRASVEWGVPAWQGAMLRLNDKVKRLQSLARKGSLANESALDSFMDIAVYALIAYVLYEEDKQMPIRDPNINLFPPGYYKHLEEREKMMRKGRR